MLKTCLFHVSLSILVYNENQNTLFSIIITVPKLELKPGLEGY